MTEVVICARCHQQFERELEDVEVSADAHTNTEMYLLEVEPVCEDCEHQYLSWLGCPPLC